MPRSLPSSRIFKRTAGVGTAILLAGCACAQVTTRGSVTIEAGNNVTTGATVVLDVLSQTNVLLTLAGPGLAVTSVSVPQSLSVANSESGAEVRLPTVVTPLSGINAVAIPNAVAMSVGGGPSSGGDGSNDVMLIVVQYN